MGTHSFPTEKGTAAPTFRSTSIVAKGSPMSATAELLFERCVNDIMKIGRRLKPRCPKRLLFLAEHKTAISVDRNCICFPLQKLPKRSWLDIAGPSMVMGDLRQKKTIRAYIRLGATNSQRLLAEL